MVNSVIHRPIFAASVAMLMVLATSTFRQSQATFTADAVAVGVATLKGSCTPIRAPFAGPLGRSLVDEGTLINAAGTKLNTLVQLDPICVTFNRSATDLKLLGKYRAKTIPAEVSIPDQAGRRYEGAATFLDSGVEPNTGTIVARATIANLGKSLLPGEFVDVRLHVADRPDTLLADLRTKDVALRPVTLEVGPSARRGETGAQPFRDNGGRPVRAGIGMKRSEGRSQDSVDPRRD